MSSTRSYTESNTDKSNDGGPATKRQRIAIEQENHQTQKRTTSEQIVMEASNHKMKWNECIEAIKLCLKTTLIDEIIYQLITFCQPPSFKFEPTIAIKANGNVYDDEDCYNERVHWDIFSRKTGEMCQEIMDKSISDYCIIACGYCKRIIEDIKNGKGDKFKNCLFIGYTIWHREGDIDDTWKVRRESKVCMIDETNGDAQFLMDAMDETKITRRGNKDLVAFRGRAPLRELMELDHCANFGHSGLYKIQCAEYLGKRIVELLYDTESG